MSGSEKIVVPGTNVLRRAGNTLISSEASETQKIEAFKVLTAWRSLHTYPIDTFQKTLKRRCVELKFKDFTVAQRLKRLPSIVSKLKRHPGMNLARMQDIGGLRVILPSIQDVYRLHADLIHVNKRFSHEPKLPCDDYIHNPKKDGYRSLHQIFIYKSRDHAELDGLSIELQIRTKLQHSWATAVETLGIIEKASIKSGFGSDDHKKFFKLSSALFSIKEQTPMLTEFSELSPHEIALQAKEIEERLQIFKKLKGIAITAKHIESTSNSRYAYHILRLYRDEDAWKVDVMPFSKNQEDLAKTFYASLEASVKSDPDVDVVLVSVGDLKAIKKAYPNYFLDTNQFIKEMQSAFKKFLEV
ncbi:RelA/SpoT family protein [Acinetobacter sp. BIGb0102]|uniref:RelA/SpoT domain-containing protein n=1 Tax=Acinetobacter sp. BIGb0102 TaxID=2485131 RepID=UPI000F508472|nr:RelA/SpoT domain-containing protein [Acinetobacter sp. BIGb0102]RPE30865.1 RelA/SpoT family protein [Acinetobacter sp. BIGb0102]